MNKILVFGFIFFSIQLNAQLNQNWAIINPGFFLNNGISKLIVKQKSVYIHNANFSTLIRSTDRGVNWDSISIPSDSIQHLYNDLYFVNDSIGYIVGYDGSVFSSNNIESIVKKTNDRGLTWQKMNNGITNSTLLEHIVFFDENNGLVFGTGNPPATLFSTSNAGLNWSSLPNNGISPYSVSYSSFSGNKGVVTGFNNHMELDFTYDGGNNWDIRHFYGSSSATGLQFFGIQNGVVISNDSIFFTSDSANSFFFKTKFPFHPVIRSFAMLDMQRGFFCSDKGIYYTNDGCMSWTLSYYNPNLEIKDVLIEGNDVFASTFVGNVILKLDISALKLKNDEINSKLFLTMFPNPAKNEVSFAVANNSKLISATIYDQLGRVVLEQNLNTIHTLDIRTVQTGLYIVKVNTSKNVFTTKLLIE